MARIGSLVCRGPESHCILGCHCQNEPTSALAAYVKAKPDVSLWIGENVYADTKDDIEHIRKCYRVLWAKPGFADLKRDSIFLPTRDDHGYGLKDAGGKYPLWGQQLCFSNSFYRSKKLFMRVVPEEGQEAVFLAQN